MNDTSDNINVNTISPEEGTVTHVAIINLDIYYRTEIAVDGAKTGWFLLFSFRRTGKFNSFSDIDA